METYWDMDALSVGLAAFHEEVRRHAAKKKQRQQDHLEQRQDALTIEVGLGVGSQLAGALQKQNVVLLGGGEGIIVEVVDDNRGAVRRQVEIELQKKRTDGARSGGLAGESEEDVSVLVQEVDNVLGAKRRSES